MNIQIDYSELSEFERDLFEECAAILEFDGNFDKTTAEELAYKEIIKMRIPEQISADTLKALNEAKELVTLNTSQDFINSTFFYGIKLGNNSFLISSKCELFPVIESNKKGFSPIINTIEKSRFSTDRIKSYLKGERINSSLLFQKIKSYIKRFIHVTSDSYYDLLALWVMGTYIFRIFRYYPYIHLYAEKGSGKTLLMDILAPIAFNGEISCNSTAAVIYRDVHVNSPTLFIDEAEDLYKKSSEAKGALLDVLRSGFAKSGTVKRCEKDNFKVQTYSSYSPKMLASINDLDDVLRDRTIKIKMVRKLESEHVERYVETDSIRNIQKDLTDELYIFGLQYAESIFITYSKLDLSNNNLEHLSNRSADLWTPIIILAQNIDSNSINPTEPKIFNSVVELSKALVQEKYHDDSIDNTGIKILSFINKIIEEGEPLKTEDSLLMFDTDSIYYSYREQDDSEYPITKTKLSQTLRKFNVEIKNYKNTDGKSKKAYMFSPENIKELLIRYNKSEDSV